MDPIALFEFGRASDHGQVHLPPRMPDEPMEVPPCRQAALHGHGQPQLEGMGRGCMESREPHGHSVHGEPHLSTSAQAWLSVCVLCMQCMRVRVRAHTYHLHTLPRRHTQRHRAVTPSCVVGRVLAVE